MPHRPRSRAAPADAASQLLARGREGFLQTLRNAASEVIRHPAWLDVLTAAAGRCFDELAGGRKAGRGGAPIGLVRVAEADYSIALINLDQRLQDFCGRELASLHRRMRQILADGGLELGDESPLGTATVCRALRALKEAEHLSPDEALQLVRQLDLPLRRHLADFYRDLDHALAGGLRAVRRERPAVAAAVSADEWTDTPAARASLPIDPVDALRLAVLGRREAQPAPSASLDPALASVLLERIEAWLGERHRFGTGVPVSLGASELGALLSPQQAAAVEVVETVCTFAENAPSLPAAVRGLFTGLRVPLLRLALRSEKLLSLERHPALRLVDRIAAVGRTLPPDCTLDLPVCRGLASMVRSLGRLPRPARSDFEMALAVLEALLLTRQRGALTRAAAHIEAALRMEHREVALHQASRAVYLLVGQEPPSAARNFLERYWVHVLAKAVYLYGLDSPQWAARLLTANRLLASALTPADEAARLRLAAEFPAIVYELDEGLTWIALPARQAGAALASCQTMHASLLAGESPPVPTLRRASSPPTLGAPAGSPGLRTLKHKQYVAGELSPPPEWALLQPGDSVAIGLPDGKVMRGYVAHLAPAGQVMLISDGDRNAVLAITARALAQQCSAAGTQMFGDESIVDQATTDRLINP